MDIFLYSEISSYATDEVQAKLKAVKDGEDIVLHVNSYGGDVMAGWAIYDLLRQQSGHTIKAIVEGVCASMASVVILAATKENRKATPDASFLVHFPEVGYISGDMYERLTAENLEKIKQQVEKTREETKTEEDKIVAVMVERTGIAEDIIRTQMQSEKWFGTDRAIELGLISGVEEHKTARAASKNSCKKMKKINAKVKQTGNVLRRLFADFIRTSVDGVEVEIDNETGVPEVGVTARPDGTFVLDDGVTIVIEGGVITAVEKPAEGGEGDAKKKDELDEETATRLAALETKLADVEERLAKLEGGEQKPAEEQTDEADKEIVAFVKELGGLANLKDLLGGKFRAFRGQKPQEKNPQQQPEVSDKAEQIHAEGDRIRERLGIRK